MFDNDDKSTFLDKVIEYGIGINLSGYNLNLLCLDLMNCLSEYSYYSCRIVKHNIVEIANEKGSICELEVGNLGIFFVKYEIYMAKNITPIIVKFFSEKTFI